MSHEEINHYPSDIETARAWHGGATNITGTPLIEHATEVANKDGRRVYEAVAQLVVDKWNTNGNVIVEAGATYPEALKKVREIVGEDIPILTAGVGIQGGKVTDLGDVFGKDGKRLFVNSSRGIIFAGEGKPDYFKAVREAAENLRQSLLQASKKQ